MTWQTSDLMCFYAMVCAAARDIEDRPGGPVTEEAPVPLARMAGGERCRQQRFTVTLRFDVLVERSASSNPREWRDLVAEAPGGGLCFRGTIEDPVSVVVQRVGDLNVLAPLGPASRA